MNKNNGFTLYIYVVLLIFGTVILAQPPIKINASIVPNLGFGNRC